MFYSFKEVILGVIAVGFLVACEPTEPITIDTKDLSGKFDGIWEGDISTRKSDTIITPVGSSVRQRITCSAFKGKLKLVVKDGTINALDSLLSEGGYKIGIDEGYVGQDGSFMIEGMKTGGEWTVISGGIRKKVPGFYTIKGRFDSEKKKLSGYIGESIGLVRTYACTRHFKISFSGTE